MTGPGSEIVRSTLIRRTLILAFIFFGLLRFATYLDLIEDRAAIDNDFTPDYVSAAEWRRGGNASCSPPRKS